MAVLKVIEVLANSSKSWEDATNKALEQASKSVKNIRSIYINEQSAIKEKLSFIRFGTPVLTRF